MVPVMLDLTGHCMTLAIEKLFTRRLLLRRVEPDDIDLLVAWSRSIESCGDYLSPEEYDQSQLQQQLGSGVFWNDKEKLFMIEKKEDGQAIGTIHFWQPTGKPETRVVALKVAEAAERNKGYGTEAQKFLMIYLFDRMGVKIVEMYTDINNLPQQRCLKKLGFELVESLHYDDQRKLRTGNLYRLGLEKYHTEPIYRYHYE